MFPQSLFILTSLPADPIAPERPGLPESPCIETSKLISDSNNLREKNNKNQLTTEKSFFFNILIRKNTLGPLVPFGPGTPGKP